MESKLKEILVLELKKHEADWLRSYLQNSKGDPHEESEDDSKMRKLFFEALSVKSISSIVRN